MKSDADGQDVPVPGVWEGVYNRDPAFDNAIGSAPSTSLSPSTGGGAGRRGDRSGRFSLGRQKAMDEPFALKWPLEAFAARAILVDESVKRRHGFKPPGALRPL